MDATNSNLSSVTIHSHKKSNNAISHKPSVKAYAARVFQGSTVGIVSSIFTTHNKRRRFFQVFLSSMCIAGFIYHCTTFLNHVLAYPEVVDISRNRSKTYNWPAYSYCRNNPIRRSVFCRLFPQNCARPSKEFCKKYFYYCADDSILVPDERFYTYFHYGIQSKLIAKYGNVEDLIIDNYRYKDGHKVYKDPISGPFLRAAPFGKIVMPCYSMHSVVESINPPLQKKRSVQVPNYDETIVFNIMKTEMMNPRIIPGIYFTVHSPFDGANPLDNGIFLNDGRDYVLDVKMEEEVLLKAPFGSNCIDYDELWEKNDFTGPRTKKMCQEKCALDNTIMESHCAFINNLYPNKEKICGSMEEDIFSNHTTPQAVPGNGEFHLEKCLENCRDECRSFKYTTEVFDNGEVFRDDDKEYGGYITVTIRLSNDEVKVLRHSPKYETVDVISSVGGFMGCWLGIALMDILDVFGSIITVCRYAFRKKLNEENVKAFAAVP